jgi:hypothetical protein
MFTKINEILMQRSMLSIKVVVNYSKQGKNNSSEMIFFSFRRYCTNFFKQKVYDSVGKTYKTGYIKAELFGKGGALRSSFAKELV